MSPAYGVEYDVWRGHQGVAKRSVFVIDRQGMVRYRWVTDDALVLPDFDAAIAVLPQLRQPTGGEPGRAAAEPFHTFGMMWSIKIRSCLRCSSASLPR